MVAHEENRRYSVPKSVDKEMIVDAALDLLNKEGIDGLSMRRLADALGIRAASLYWHIKNKSELLQLMSDRICEKITFPDPLQSWEQQLRDIADRYRIVLMSYRDSAEIMANTIPFTPHRLKLIECIYHLFSQAGIPNEEIPLAAWLLNNYVLAFVMDEARTAQQVMAEKEMRYHEKKEVLEKKFKSLPVNEYPLFVQLAETSVHMSAEQQFAFGLEVLIEGFKAKIKSRTF